MAKAAAELREYCYDETEMRGFLGGSRGPLEQSTMRGRIYRKKNCPPWIKVGSDYWFPKDLYADWLRQRPASYEVASA